MRVRLAVGDPCRSMSSDDGVAVGDGRPSTGSDLRRPLAQPLQHLLHRPPPQVITVGRPVALLRLAHQAAQSEEVVDAGDDGDRDRDVEQHVDPAGVGSKPIAKKIAATCTIVFALPHQFAEITTPWPVARQRATVTANSRAMMTIATQAGIRSSETSTTSAAMTSSLSATGSMSLPNVVIVPRCARGSRRSCR